MHYLRVYDRPGTPLRTAMVYFYEQRFVQEKGECDIPQMEAVRFAEYLLEHLADFQAELAIIGKGWEDMPEPPTIDPKG